MHFRRYSLRTLLALTGLSAVCFGGYIAYTQHRLWRNTRFHCPADGIVTLPNGETFPTNVWVTTDIDFPLAHIGLGTRRNGMELHYFSKFSDGTKVATITVDRKTTNAVVTNYTATGSANGRHFHCEYWILPESDL